MKVHFIHEVDFKPFLKNLMSVQPVIGPVAKKNQFIFSQLKVPEELRLDYDVSLLPPKKAIFPVKQKLLEFGPQGVRSCIEPKEQVLFGVHFYDIKALDMLDLLFEARYPDHNYLAQRQATTVVGSNIQKISPRGFFSSVGVEVKPEGHDAFLTKIHVGGESGYLLEIFTPKGEKLLSHGKFIYAKQSHLDAAFHENKNILEKCREKLQYTDWQISGKVRASFRKKELWEEMAKDCFSCGTCNIVCPTCYCFDVQDEWNLDQKSGMRCRTWDGCLLEDFAKVSLGGGAGGSENFREERSTRFRHRMMRKASYLNEKLGGPACVGCGRCSMGCVPDIADPVSVIHRLMEN